MLEKVSKYQCDENILKPTFEGVLRNDISSFSSVKCSHPMYDKNMHCFYHTKVFGFSYFTIQPVAQVIFQLFDAVLDVVCVSSSNNAVVYVNAILMWIGQKLPLASIFLLLTVSDLGYFCGFGSDWSKKKT